MNKKKEGTGDLYAYLDEGCGVKLAGIHFTQGEPHKIPEHYREDVESHPLFANVKGDKKLTPSECATLRKAELKKATARRDAWRAEYKKDKKVPGAPVNAPVPEGGDEE